MRVASQSRTPDAAGTAGRRSRAPSADQLAAVVAAQRLLACAPPEPAVIFAMLAETAWSLLGCDGALVSQSRGDVLVVRGTAGDVPNALGSALPIEGTLSGVALRTMSSQICDDWHANPRNDTRLTGPGSFVVVPLVSYGQVIALLGAYSSATHAFDDQDLELLATFADVGAHRLAHALTLNARDALQAQSQAVLEATSGGLLVIDLQGMPIYVNQKAQDILGLTLAKMIDGTFDDDHWPAIHEDGTAWPRHEHPAVVTLLTGEAQRDQTMGLVKPSGEKCWITVNAVPMLDAAGLMTGVVCSLDDITARRAVTAGLAASEQHFRVAFDNAPIGMSMLSLAPGSEGRYLSANAAFCAMVGYTAVELAELAMADLTHPDDIEQDRARFASILRGATSSVAFDKRFRRKDGEIVYAWLTTSVAVGPSGEALYLITHAVDMTSRREQNAELERLALTDMLTGLANRTLLTDRLDQALARLQRVETACALLLLDIDRFKLVNDSLGHQVGDALLVEVARRLEAVSRADSTVARLGGDEFVVLVEGLTEPNHVHTIAERLLDTLRRPYVIDGATGSIVATVSIGISVARSPDRFHNDLYREADLALYRAKDGGRDQYAVFDDDLRLKVERRMQAESLLRSALADDRISPRYQPLIDLGTGKIVAVEALARIDDQERGLVGPMDFVDVAEETGLIVELDARMFELAAAQFARWQAEGLPIDAFGCNASPRSLRDPGFVDRVGTALRANNVPGSAVRVEITERSLLTSDPKVRTSLQRIEALGVEVGLDDFGTGYSALAYLKNFDLSFLKIDRTFVNNLGNARDDAVAGAVIALAHAHQLRVIAEGVETVEQLEAVRELGCDRAQGFLIGKPLTADDLSALVRAGRRW